MRLPFAFCAFALCAVSLAGCATPSADDGRAKAAVVSDAPMVDSAVDGAVDGAVDMSEVVCKRQKVIGSNFRRDVCHTRLEWKQMEATARRDLGNAQRGGPVSR